METLKRIASFMAICIFILATIGGTAYLFFYGQYLFGATNILLAAMAVPFIIERVKALQQ